jgi:hypothetical protein
MIHRLKMNQVERQRGQSLIETAIVFMVLVLLLYGVVEVGFGLRNYILVSNANREAARLASRGDFLKAGHGPESVATRMVSSGGGEMANEETVPFLRLTDVLSAGASANTGIIFTYIYMDDAGAITNVETYVEGVITCDGGCEGTRPLVAADTKINLADIEARHGPLTVSINNDRVNTHSLQPLDNPIVVVETFFAHEPWGHGLVPSPWSMYAQSEMRVLTGRSGGGAAP